jgi:hypothetical protein
MLDAIKPLLDNGIINESVGQAINEAWESKLNEAREQVRAELREEFARKYEHDKNVMVEALDKMITEGLSAEIAEFHEERRAMNEDRVKSQQKMRESAQKFNNFMVTKLADEIRELRDDRKLQVESRGKLENFVVKALAREIREFETDKRAVVEAKVKLVAEARQQLQQLKAKFVAESAKRVSKAVGKHLKTEITQLKEDIKIASESNFGRRLFEAFAAEYSTTHLNEKSETRKVLQKLAHREHQLSEAVKAVKQSRVLIENKEREVRVIKENNLRDRTMGELLGTLNEEKAEIMRNLLESVQTPKLKAAFDKYLPAVLHTITENKPTRQGKTMISESVVVTGDKTAKNSEVEIEERDNVIAIKRLAGL